MAEDESTFSEDDETNNESDEENCASYDEDQEDVIPPALAATVAEDIKGHRFNEDTGMWEYPSLSRLKPSQDASLLLQQAIQSRHTFCHASFGHDIVGYLHTAPDGGYHELPPPIFQLFANVVQDGYAFLNGEIIAVSHHGPV